MRLLPNQLYSLELEDFCNMICAFELNQRRTFDQDMIKLAWQTSFLMNSSGRYKKNIKPKDLYQSVFIKDENNDSQMATKSKEELRKELKERFGIE